jgi:hypothetical protein
MSSQSDATSDRAGWFRQFAHRSEGALSETRKRAIPEELLHRIAQDPGNVMVYFAEEVVARTGEGAQERVDQLRAENPGLPPHHYVEKVKKDACLLAGLGGGLTGLGGWIGIAPDILWLLWVQNRMALQIAAIYGQDPTDSERAKELLVVQGVYNSVAAASAAMTKATVRVGTRLAEQYLRKGVLQAVKVALKYLGIRFTRKALIGALPLVGAPIGFAANYFFTRQLAQTAAQYYDPSITLGGSEEIRAMLLTAIRMAKADRVIRPEEEEVLSSLIASSDELSKEGKRSLEKELRSQTTTPWPEELGSFADSCAKMMMFAQAVQIAMVDGHLAGSERLLLEDLQRQLSLSDRELESLRQDLGDMGIAADMVAQIIGEPGEVEEAFRDEV